MLWIKVNYVVAAIHDWYYTILSHVPPLSVEEKEWGCIGWCTYCAVSQDLNKNEACIGKRQMPYSFFTFVIGPKAWCIGNSTAGQKHQQIWVSSICRSTVFFPTRQNNVLKCNCKLLLWDLKNSLFQMHISPNSIGLYILLYSKWY